MSPDQNAESYHRFIYWRDRLEPKSPTLGGNFVELPLVQSRSALSLWLTGSLFLFLNRRRNLIKILYWEGDGFALWYERLGDGSDLAVPLLRIEAGF